MIVSRNHPLYGCFSKIARARKHAAEFRSIVQDWFPSAETHLYSHPVGDGMVEIRVRLNGPLPDEMHHSAADAIYQARSTLDQMIQAIGQQLGINALDTLAFPFMKRESEFEKASKSKLRGLPDGIISAVYDLKPWHDQGNKELWGLGRLANIDKHRLLIPFGGLGEMSHMGGAAMHGGSYPNSRAFVWKEGNLIEGVPISLIGEDGYFRPGENFELGLSANIVFDDPVEIFSRQVASPKMDELIEMVHNIVVKFS